MSTSFKEASQKISGQAKVDGPILKDNLKGLTKKNSMSKELLKANLKVATHDLKQTTTELKTDLTETGSAVKNVAGELAKQSKQEMNEAKIERQGEREYELYQDAFQEELDLENSFKN